MSYRKKKRKNKRFKLSAICSLSCNCDYDYYDRTCGLPDGCFIFILLWPPQRKISTLNNNNNIADMCAMIDIYLFKHIIGRSKCEKISIAQNDSNNWKEEKLWKNFKFLYHWDLKNDKRYKNICLFWWKFAFTFSWKKVRIKNSL